MEKQYLDVEYLTAELTKEYKFAREKHIRNAENSGILDTICDDEFIEEYAATIADNFNEDMKHYLHQSDHKIMGNFGNIDYDYPRHRLGVAYNTYNRKMVDDLTSRLDNNCQDEQTKSDRHWLVDWFFERFGSYNVSYNFTAMINESIYQYNQENSND